MYDVDSSTIMRLCPECLTTDAAFPLKNDCKSCRQMLSNDEFRFWNVPVVLETEYCELSTPLYSKKYILIYNILSIFCKYICLS
jgi:hypothetical protein